MNSATMTLKKNLFAVQEKIQTISQSVYIQWGMVLSMLALTALFVEFRVTTESNILMLQKTVEKQEVRMDDFERKYPTKEWLEAKLESIRLEIKQANLEISKKNN